MFYNIEVINMVDEKINFDNKDDTKDFYDELIDELVNDVVNEIESDIDKEYNLSECYCDLKLKLEELWNQYKESFHSDDNDNVPKQLREIVTTALKYIFLLK
jgi:hypothetical protein